MVGQWDLGQRALIVDVVEVVRPTKDAVRDEEVLEAVVIQINEERCPAPVGGVYAGQVPDVAEAGRLTSAAAIELQCVAGVLGVIARLQLEVEDVEALGVGR